jgi:hypothetical protein
MNTRDTSRILEKAARQHIPDDTNLLPQITAKIEQNRRKMMKPALKWAIALVIVLTLIVISLFSIPGAVQAMQRLFGYIPGVGLVETGTSIRVLSEPVTQTREGVIVAVTSAIITNEKTVINLQIAGIPLSAYPEGEAVTGCMQQSYLRLPDGTRMDLVSNLPPLPADVNDVVVVVPCIFNTLPGTVPENWELPLHFVPAPPDLTIVPVTEILPSPTTTLPPAADTLTSVENPLVVTKVLEIGTNYVIMGELRYAVTQDASLPGGSWWVVKKFKLTDANGQNVPFTYPEDIELPTPDFSQNWETWAAQVDKNFAGPLNITYQGVVISPVGSKEQVEYQFDAGTAPQSGAQWQINQDFKLGGYNIRLVSIEFDPRVGYNFNFQSDPGASSNLFTVDIDGYTPDCGGGGGGEDLPAVEFSRNVCVYNPATAPSGNLKVILSFQKLDRQDKTFTTQWQPENLGTYATSTPAPDLCITTGSLAGLAPAPAALNGKVLLSSANEDGSDPQLFVSNLDGSQQQLLNNQGGWAAISPDGRFATDGTNLYDLTSGGQASMNGSGYDMHWSPDNSRLAFQSGDGIFVLNLTDATPAQRLTSQAHGYEDVVGWSANSSKIYFNTQDIGGWMLKTVDIASGEISSLFVLQESSLKAPNATISPDAQWLVYRNRALDSLYMMGSDGSQLHKILELPGWGISGSAWSLDSQTLFLSLLNFDTQQRSVVMLRPQDCQAFLLPALSGDVQGVYLP